jgi:hypothetical protein
MTGISATAMNALPPMTEMAARKLAKAKWGESAYAVQFGDKCYVGATGIEYAVGDSWREACDRAGLLHLPTHTPHSTCKGA